LKAESTGGRVEYMEFPHTREMDDLYTLTVNMADKANNTVSETIRSPSTDLDLPMRSAMKRKRWRERTSKKHPMYL